MAVYRVTAPDGSVHDITAPDGATPAQVQAYARENLQPAKHSSPSWLDSIQGAASSVLDGVLPGTAGVASGIGGVIGNAIRAPFSSKEDFRPADAFRAGRELAENNEEQFKRRNPTTGALATTAGFVGGLALPMTKLGLGAKGAKAALKGRVLNSAANGALYGGTSAALSSHADGVGGVVRDAARGSTVGGALASGLPVAGRLAAPIVQPIAEGVGHLAAPILRSAGNLVGGAAGRNLQNRAAILGASPAEATASRYIGGVMDKAGLDSAGLMQELKRRQDLGVPAVPADVNEHLREAYGSATRRPGPATMAVRRAIDERQRQMTQRVTQHIGDTLGPITNVEAQANALNQQAKEAARPLYEISDAQPIPFVNELRSLFEHPDAKDALNIAGKQIWADAIAKGHPNPTAALREHGLVQRPDGVFEIANVPPMKMYDHANSAFASIIYGGNKFAATPEMDRAGKATSDLRRRLLQIMDGDGSGPRITQPGKDIVPAGPGGVPAPGGQPTAPAQVPPQLSEQASRLPTAPPSVRSSVPVVQSDVGPWTGQRLEPEAEDLSQKATGRMSAIPPEGLNPYWKAAREAYAGPVQNRKALELGQDMAKANATDAANRMDNMAGSQADHFRLGHRTGMVEDLQKLGDYGNAARRVDGSMAKRDAVSTVHGGQAAEDLFDRLQAEHGGHQTWQAVRGNSWTAGREIADQIAEQEQAIANAGEGIWAFARGRPLDAMRHISGAFSGEPARTNAVNDRVSTTLSAQDPTVVRNAMKDVRRAQVAAASSERRGLSAGQQSAKVVGSRTGAGLATPPAGQVLLGYGQDDDGSLYPVFGAPGTNLGPDYLPPDP